MKLLGQGLRLRIEDPFQILERRARLQENEAEDAPILSHRNEPGKGALRGTVGKSHLPVDGAPLARSLDPETDFDLSPRSAEDGLAVLDGCECARPLGKPVLIGDERKSRVHGNFETNASNLVSLHVRAPFNNIGLGLPGWCDPDLARSGGEV